MAVVDMCLDRNHYTDDVIWRYYGFCSNYGLLGRQKPRKAAG
jgi:hypothetical protein